MAEGNVSQGTYVSESHSSLLTPHLTPHPSLLTPYSIAWSFQSCAGVSPLPFPPCCAGKMYGEPYSAKRMVYSQSEEVLVLQSFGTGAVVVSGHHFCVNMLINCHKHPLIGLCIVPTRPELVVTLDASGYCCVSSVASSNNSILAPVMQTFHASCGRDARHLFVLSVSVYVKQLPLPSPPQTHT